MIFGMPPIILAEESAIGRIPPNRTDTGAYLISEVFAVKSRSTSRMRMVYIPLIPRKIGMQNLFRRSQHLN